MNILPFPTPKPTKKKGKANTTAKVIPFSMNIFPDAVKCLLVFTMHHENDASIVDRQEILKSQLPYFIARWNQFLSTHPMPVMSAYLSPNKSPYECGASIYLEVHGDGEPRVIHKGFLLYDQFNFFDESGKQFRAIVKELQSSSIGVAS